jgi:hypothetical protein
MLPLIRRHLLLGWVDSRIAGASPAQEEQFGGLGVHTRPVSTSSRTAQSFFNQGLNFLFGFNHDEAIRSFEQATWHDPGCAMAWWGIAYALGPHINYPLLPPDKAKAAWEALVRARESAPKATRVEQELIGALGCRYADPSPDDRASLYQAYADAMRVLRAKHPGDADIGALTAEALMDVHPWDLYERDDTPGSSGLVPQGTNLIGA